METNCKPNTGIQIDFEIHVVPLLHLARMAITLEHAVRAVDDNRANLPELDTCLKQLGCITAMGESVAEYAGLALLSAINLIEAHERDRRAGDKQ
jgi:hypothetical protein